MTLNMKFYILNHIFYKNIGWNVYKNWKKHLENIAENNAENMFSRNILTFVSEYHLILKMILWLHIEKLS